MRITHFGHACLLVESGATRVLIDAGSYSSGFEGLTALDAVLITHSHPDHIDGERLTDVLEANPQARLLVEPETTTDYGFSTGAAFGSGTETTVGTLSVTGLGGQHARNHDQTPPLGNVGFLIRDEAGMTLFHPGDSYADTPDDVDALALPLNAPWARMSETLAFLRAVAPTVVVPIHDGLLNPAGRAAYLMHVEKFGPEATEVRDLSDGSTADL